MKNRTIYYSDELNDDFAGGQVNVKKVNKDFKFIHKNPIWRFFAFILYYIIAFPIIWFYEVCILRVKFVNKKALKSLKHTPFFMYGNHTGVTDAYTPQLISCPRKNYIVVSPATVSIKGIKNIVQMLGAVPVPTELNGFPKFLDAIETLHKKNNITIYPEAHIWPYYTGVRPFKDVSFKYPAKLNSPVVAFFVAYTKPKGFLSFLRHANVTVYVSDPIYPNMALPEKERQKALRDAVYNFMVEKSKFSTYEYIKYIKKDQ